jgi:cell division septation protein DedD
MKRQTGWALAVGAVLIILAVILYYLLGGGPGTKGPSTAPAPGAPGATAPAKPAPPEPVAPLTVAPPGPPQGVAPGPESKVTVLPPQAGQEKYGILAGSFKRYRDAARLLGRLKKAGQPAFVQRDPRDLERFQVWLGPFSSQGEAEDAAKSLKTVLKKPLKIEAIENPVPK